MIAYGRLSSPLSISTSHMVFFYTSSAAEMKDFSGVLEAKVCCHFLGQMLL